jgi:ribokinase
VKPVVVVGSYNTGLTMRVERLPRQGETLMGTDYSEGPGGKGSNQAVAARRLGARVRFVGCVGKDKYGDAALGLWKAEGIETDLVRRTHTHTGLGFVIVDSQGSNSIVIDPGANMDLSPEDVKRGERALAESGVLLLQLEIRRLTVEASASLAKPHGATVILNPAPAMRANDLELKDVDLLTPNEQEFALMTGTDDLETGAKELLSMGPKAVVVTLGSRGARVVTPSDSYLVPTPKVKALDTTGAGDAFNGALAVALSEGEPLRHAVAFANYAGALTVTRREVIPALPSRAEVEEFRRNDILE